MRDRSDLGAAWTTAPCRTCGASANEKCDPWGHYFEFIGKKPDDPA